jgi:hypothetical protein
MCICTDIHIHSFGAENRPVQMHRNRVPGNNRVPDFRESCRLDHRAPGNPYTGHPGQTAGLLSCGEFGGEQQVLRPQGSAQLRGTRAHACVLLLLPQSPREVLYALSRHECAEPMICASNKCVIYDEFAWCLRQQR